MPCYGLLHLCHLTSLYPTSPHLTASRFPSSSQLRSSSPAFSPNFSPGSQLRLANSPSSVASGPRCALPGRIRVWVRQDERCMANLYKEGKGREGE
ncbi:hypothetical protein E2C01_084030 [Portunus trituberculatus]|uniref:Uncharacterized protein n=1 Tax=Portunus trituberculatus TaxID=210409 RepID=A0A5B7J834_PORTR|nr:hypothetical protein [Portunus trituberculatus]